MGGEADDGEEVPRTKLGLRRKKVSKTEASKRKIKPTERRAQERGPSTSVVEVEVQMERRTQQVSKRIKRNRKAGIVCPAQGIVLAEPQEQSGSV